MAAQNGGSVIKVVSGDWGVGFNVSRHYFHFRPAVPCGNFLKTKKKSKSGPPSHLLDQSASNEVQDAAGDPPKLEKLQTNKKSKTFLEPPMRDRYDWKTIHGKRFFHGDVFVGF